MHNNIAMMSDEECKALDAQDAALMRRLRQQGHSAHHAEKTAVRASGPLPYWAQHRDMEIPDPAVFHAEAAHAEQVAKSVADQRIAALEEQLQEAVLQKGPYFVVQVI